MPPVPRTPTEAYWPHSESAFRRRPPWAGEPSLKLPTGLLGEFPGTPAIPSRGRDRLETVQFYKNQDAWTPPESLTDAGALPPMLRRAGGFAALREAGQFSFATTVGTGLTQSSDVVTNVSTQDSRSTTGMLAASPTDVTSSKPADRPVWPWVVGGLGVVGLLGGLVYALNRKKRRRNPRARRRRRSGGRRSSSRRSPPRRSVVPRRRNPEARALDKRELRKEIRREERKRQKAELSRLRSELAVARASRRELSKTCRTGGDTLRAERNRVRALIRTLEAECKTLRSEKRQAVQAADERIRAERRYQKEIRAAEKKKPERVSSREKRQESDTEVESNIRPELVSLWRKMKRQFRATPRKSRTEAFEEWIEAHPDVVLEVQQAEADRWLRKTVRAERRATGTQDEVPF